MDSKLLKEKNQRLIDIPLRLQTVVKDQEKKVLSQIIAELRQLTTKDGKIEITSENLKIVGLIADQLKSIYLNATYLKAVGDFAKEFDIQAKLNDKLIQESLAKK